ncbi:MAG: HipA domain-containing protein [Leptospiraceae bacterium]|nr:HipA domain-containing protein [Leptospiraceae bacterium]
MEYTYDPDWLSDPDALPLSLSLPLQTKTYSGSIVENYFDNLLPDNIAIRGRIASITQAKSEHVFDLLSTTGADCVGALQLLPEARRPDIKKIKSQTISPAKIADRLRNLRINPLGMQANEDFRISLAGVQTKTAFLKLKNKWHIPLGFTPTSHIFKQQIETDFNQFMGADLTLTVENEYLCHLIFKAFEIPIANCSISDFEDQRVLVVKRFDRSWKENGLWLARVPQEDFCQVYGISSNRKYENEGGPGIKAIMDILASSAKSYSDQLIFIKTQILFWFLLAIDGHAKNFSIFHLKGGRFCLTPVYDVLSAWPLETGNFHRQKLKMAMAVIGKNRHYNWHQISSRHWLSTASFCGINPADVSTFIELICDTLDKVIDAIQTKLPPDFPDRVATTIFEGMRFTRNKAKK